MSAVDPVSTNDSYFINGRNISGASGTLFGRVAEPSTDTLVQLERLATRIIAPVSHYDELHALFEKREVVLFEIHRGLKVTLSVTAVIAEVVKKDDSTAVLLEYDLA
ncbi:MAG: hypothetical protein LUC93_18430 [Planctomycetaceae bacterium]|nr:hypothetical protein [Planctomycetaceae bacterium]